MLTIPRGRCWPWSLTLLLALALAGCAATATAGASVTPTPSPLPLVTRAQVVRITAFPTNHTPAFAGVSATPAAAQRLYAALMALPISHLTGFQSCPADLGIAYHISIYSGATLQLQAWAKPDGCEQVKVGDSAVLRGSTAQFWQTLASALGVTENQLLADLASRPTGPYAVPAGPSDWTTP